jgi:serine O-acetyltransferase
MRVSLGKADLSRYIARQLNNLFPDEVVIEDHLSRYVTAALERTEYCFSHINAKYFCDAGQVLFSHLHTDQYAMFLYFLCNTLYRMNGDLSLASKVYALNKSLHAIDVYYEVKLPDIFYFQHPVGTVLGRASYSNYFFVYQRCSTGANLDDVYPRLGEGVVMYGNSAIIGDCTVGDNCWLSFGAVVTDQDLPSDSVVFGRSPNIVIKSTRRQVTRDLFRIKSQT